MSTTVSYKGQTLTTVSNDTKTLLTDGKYLEDDLTLIDVSGGGSTLITKSISANGTYNASSDSADGYSQVNVAVPNTYTNADEGKVVSDGALVAQTSKNINSNGTHSTVTNNQVVVAVPNSYSAGDEGKVVSNGALVAQTSDTVTTNDTYDTTIINSLTVNVSGGGSIDWDGFVTGDWPTGAVTLQTATKIPTYKFYSLSGITDVSAPNVTEIEVTAFRLSGITSLYAPSLTSIAGDAIRQCYYFKGGYFPELLTLGGSVFYNSCTSAQDPVFVFPSLTTVGTDCFRQACGANAGIVVDFGSNLTSLPTRCFYNAAKKTKLLVLRRTDDVVAASSANALTDIVSTTEVRVPSALVSAYQTASNWSTKYAEGVEFLPIEGSIYETQYADGTPIPTT